MNQSVVRSRWAAIGAAVAITLGAGGIGLVSATSPDGATAYTPIEPCRVADTRSIAEFNVGPKNTPIGPEQTHVIAAHGDNGECTGIPTTATGLQLNVTSLNATTGTFLAVWGSGERPNVSNLNPQPGQPPIPNAVTTGLTSDGRFNVFNRAGSVDVIVDIVGFYGDHHHLTADADGGDDSVTVSIADKVVATITVDTPGPGVVIAHSSAYAQADQGITLARCAINTRTSLGQVIQNESLDENEFASLAGTRSFEVEVGGDTSLTLNLVCDRFQNVVVDDVALPTFDYTLHDANLTAVFVPTPAGS